MCYLTLMPNTRARQLRTELTDAERRLWSALRDRRLAGYKFRRQRPVGPFILDFACIEQRLAIEADGGQHADNDYDLRRTAWLEGHGWRGLRFWNNDILANSEGVVDEIVRWLQANALPPPHPPVPDGPGPSLSRKR